MFLVLERDSINLRMSISIFSATYFFVSFFICDIKALEGDCGAVEMKFKDMSLHCFIFGGFKMILNENFENELAVCPIFFISNFCCLTTKPSLILSYPTYPSRGVARKARVHTRKQTHIHSKKISKKLLLECFRKEI